MMILTAVKKTAAVFMKKDRSLRAQEKSLKLR